jgi:ankyrin repeat protein
MNDPQPTAADPLGSLDTLIDFQDHPQEALDEEESNLGDQKRLSKLLFEAVEDGDLPALRKLLDQGADPACFKKAPMTPFGQAIASGFNAGFAAMLDAFPVLATTACARAKRSPLMVAAIEGNLEAAATLLPLSNPNLQDDDGDTALSLACALGWIDVAELLLPLTDMSLMDSGQKGPAEAVLHCYGNDTFSRLRGKAPAPHLTSLDGGPAVPGWSRLDRLACFQALAPHSPQFSSFAAFDGTPWHALVLDLDRAPLLAELLRLAPPDRTLASSLLARAIHHNAIACSELLIPLAHLREPIPPAKFLDNQLFGLLPLALAASLDRVDICERLLRADPALARASGPGKRPLSLAAQNGCERSTRLLVPVSDLLFRAPTGLNPLDDALGQGKLSCCLIIWEQMRAQGLHLSGEPFIFSLHISIDEASDDASFWVLNNLPKEHLIPTLSQRGTANDGMSPLEKTLALNHWKLAQALLDLDPQAANSRDALGWATRPKTPKRLFKNIFKASSAWLFAPLSHGMDAFELAMAHKNYRAAKRLAKAALRRDDKPRGWEAMAWRTLAACSDAKRAKPIASMLRPWLRSLKKSRLDRLLLDALSCPPAPLTPMLARLLLRAGARFDGADDAALRPFHQSVRAGDLSMVEIFLQAGADPLARPAPFSWEGSALGIACSLGHASLVRALAEAAEPETSQEAFAACLALAAISADADKALHCSQALLERLAPSTAWPLDELGRCPLMRAVRAGNHAVVALLAPLGDMARRDISGASVLEIFLKMDWPTNKQLLKLAQKAFETLLEHEPAPLDLDGDFWWSAKFCQPSWPTMEPVLARFQERQALRACAVLPERPVSATARRL